MKFFRIRMNGGKDDFLPADRAEVNEAGCLLFWAKDQIASAYSVGSWRSFEEITEEAFREGIKWTS